ncbi:MAG: hypothetical protein JSS49_23300 [Planctomycetes bacterium]|nr:hypothetical protein [Planctomycetota bacterium]
MNYFAHALLHLDRPYFVAGTAVPDWLSVIDRRVRLRPRQLIPWLDSAAPIQSEIAAGAAQHLHDDGWFHATRGFVEVTGQLTLLFRRGLGADDKFNCGFLGHVGMELLLDAILMERHPAELERYYEVLASVNPAEIQAAVNRMARQPTDRLAWFVELFRQKQFLRDYFDDQRLLVRLNQVLERVKLSPLPATAEELLAAAREIVRQRVDDLLPARHYFAGNSAATATLPPDRLSSTNDTNIEESTP